MSNSYLILERDMETAKPAELAVDDLQAIRSALHYLFRTGENYECECRASEGCCVETPRCEAMEIARAQKDLEEILTPPPVSSRPDRLLTGYAERIFFEQFAKQNVRSPGLNSGYTLIEHILAPKSEGRDFMWIPTSYCPPITRRDAFVAYSVIQWLGTNCGRGFISECERRIVSERAIHGDLGGSFYAINDAPKPETIESQYGHHIAGEFFEPTDSRYERLAARIAKALVRSPKILAEQISA